MAVVCDFSHEPGGAGGAREGMLSVPEKGKEVQRLASPPEAGFKFGLKVQPPHPLLSTPTHPQLQPLLGELGLFPLGNSSSPGPTEVPSAGLCPRQPVFRARFLQPEHR